MTLTALLDTVCPRHNQPKPCPRCIVFRNTAIAAAVKERGPRPHPRKEGAIKPLSWNVISSEKVLKPYVTKYGPHVGEIVFPNDPFRPWYK